MITGGYKIINLGDADLRTGTTVTIPGIYNGFKNAHRKAIMISGITIAGTKKPDCFIYYGMTDHNYVFGAYGRTITVTNEDKITIA